MTLHPVSSPFQSPQGAVLDPRKFQDPRVTADGSQRAHVALTSLETLWFNTGTLCNITCRNCYIESSPRNDALLYLSTREVRGFLNEVRALGLSPREIGFTGGEPFMNPDILPMMESALSEDYEVLVLTNAMRPMQRWESGLIGLNDRFGSALTLRVSLDHHTEAVHDAERGVGAWKAALAGLSWLSCHGFSVAVAGRQFAGEAESEARAKYGQLFAQLGLAIDVDDPRRLVLFPEMDARIDVPEISEACWGILGRSPREMMCASSRMVVKRRGAERPVVVACTLTPYEPSFELGESLASSKRPVSLNHPHCAKFCVLGGGSCSAH